MPWSWASCMAPATRVEHGERPDSGAKAPPRSISSRRLGPLSSSITRNGWPVCVDVEVEDRDDVRMAKLGAGPALAQEALGGLGPEVGRGAAP